MPEQLDIERTLRKIVSNFWFEWNSDVHALFRAVDPYAWSLFRRNLYRFLRIQKENPLLYRRRLAELLIDSQFLNLMRKVEKDYKSYMQPGKTIVSEKYPELVDRTVAYFSMEYGIDILRTYSGGLGILSGDHLRGASDLGLKMTGVGLFYLHGYYRQQISSDRTMKVVYESIVPARKPVRDFLPLEHVKKKGSGTDDLILSLDMAGRTVKARVFRARIGRCELLLIDSDVHENHVHDRHITRRLYASQKYYEQERRRRLEQEILLGIGGVQALEGSGAEPVVYHLNEGHVAFASLEVIRRAMKKGLSFDEARRQTADILGFTTHTPVPEGNERFDERLVREYLQPYLDGFLSHGERETIFNCARNREDMFDMTKLSLLLSGVCRNGVSELHGEVCRRMWGFAWGKHEPEGHNVPITSITNAVHVPYWQKPAFRNLIEDSGGLDRVMEIPDEKVWSIHVECKVKLIEKVRERLAYQLLRENTDPQIIYDKTKNLLSPNAFMIGFARRFAEYKRVTMLLEDEEMLFQFMEQAYKKYGVPVNIIYAGKPHPNNYSGREKITEILNIAERLEKRAALNQFQGQIVFVQGYDIDLARYLEAGVDIWLNNPIRPLEASGTSGMKAGMNGVLNVSVSDGWVPEGIEQGKNGWMFGRGDADSTTQDRAELFDLLEKQILPAYFNREREADMFSRPWVSLMKYSIQSITRKFNTDRMLTDYVEKMYLPVIRAANAAAK